MADQGQEASTTDAPAGGATDRDMDLSAPPPPPDQQWERADADGEPAENMEGQAPTG